MPSNKTEKQKKSTYPSKIPAFLLPDKDQQQHSLKTLEEKHAVLFFYPKDNTTGCTLEAAGFNRLAKQFKKQGVALIGISGGDAKSKQKFCDKQGLDELLLLSDSDFALAKDCGVFGEKKFMGRAYQGIFRTTFVVDKKGKVLKVFENVKPEEHPQEVLEFIKGL